VIDDVANRHFPGDDDLEIVEHVFFLSGKIDRQFDIENALHFLSMERNPGIIDKFLIAKLGALKHRHFIFIDDVIESIHKFNDDAYDFNDDERRIFNELSSKPPLIVLRGYTTKRLDDFMA
jgi:hypothetical protein